MRRYVVGIDPSLKRAGITVLRLDDTGVARPKVLRDTGYSLPESAGYDDHSDRIAVNSRTVYQILDKLPVKPELVLIENMLPPKDGNFSHNERAALWYGIWSGIKARGLPRAVIQPPTLKLWATGNGRAEKEDILAAVQGWWPTIPIANHDIADSAVCAAMCAMRMGWKLPFPTRRRHFAGMTTVHWPEALVAPHIDQLASTRYRGI
ncbi:hypothetical protein [Mycolicibacterium komossense]|uniref:Holliday junction nuclease RuvC n=1 Tax=Mycolicibacterium komossense TaxID=1779 RepID=A0ABT3CMH9_9MYCO|nr:hypothetical protein [Mycolicibacterium komossense]MCV7230694.1 hypothetical protein [Mycolicibacterium komossense]